MSRLDGPKGVGIKTASGERQVYYTGIAEGDQQNLRWRFKVRYRSGGKIESEREAK